VKISQAAGIRQHVRRLVRNSSARCGSSWSTSTCGWWRAAWTREIASPAPEHLLVRAPDLVPRLMDRIQVKLPIQQER
jgi:hypothetical protein